MRKYTVYQLPNGHDNKFKGFERVSNVNLDEYVNVYEGTIDDSFDGESDMDILEDIYCLLNSRRPRNYNGHSLSVSDVIKLNDTLYYCDAFGFTKI